MLSHGSFKNLLTAFRMPCIYLNSIEIINIFICYNSWRKDSTSQVKLIIASKYVFFGYVLIHEQSQKVETTNKVLYENNAISFDTYQNSLTQLTTEEANLESAKNSLALAQKGISNHVRNQYQAQIAGVQAQIDLLQKQLYDLTILPFLPRSYLIDYIL